MVLGACGVEAQERVREFSRSYPAERFKEVTVLNQLGNVEVRQGGDLFEIRAEIRVSARSMNKADEVMEYLRVVAVEGTNMLNLSTVMEKDFTIKKLFFGVSIGVDYLVKIPKGKKLSVVNKNGSVLVGSFSGELNVDVASGDFKARDVEGDFTAKLKNGVFEVQEVNRFTGEFLSAEVKISGGKRLKLTGEGSNLNVMKADEVVAKTVGGTLFLGSVEQLALNARATRCEVRDLAESLQADCYAGGLTVYSVNQFFSTVEVTASGTAVALAFRPGGGFRVNFKHDNIKIELPPAFTLESKPTMKKKVVIESGFVGDTRYDSQLSLNITGGRVVIQ
jgi:hypothetical protein